MGFCTKTDPEIRGILGRRAFPNPRQGCALRGGTFSPVRESTQREHLRGWPTVETATPLRIPHLRGSQIGACRDTLPARSGYGRVCPYFRCRCLVRSLGSGQGPRLLRLGVWGCWRGDYRRPPPRPPPKPPPPGRPPPKERPPPKLPPGRPPPKEDRPPPKLPPKLPPGRALGRGAEGRPPPKEPPGLPPGEGLPPPKEPPKGPPGRAPGPGLGPGRADGPGPKPIPGPKPGPRGGRGGLGGRGRKIKKGR